MNKGRFANGKSILLMTSRARVLEAIDGLCTPSQVMAPICFLLMQRYY